MSMDIISFDPLPSHNSDNYPGEPAALPAHFLNDVPQELGDMDNELPCQGYTGGDHFGDYLALLADQAGLQLGAPEESLDWSTLPNHIMTQPPSALVPQVDDEYGEPSFPSASPRSQPEASLKRYGSSSSTPASDPGVSTPAPKVHSRSAIRQPRRQNHSCDQCRSSKKACDLPLSTRIRRQKPANACTMCNLRGLECTAQWLASKKSGQHARKRARNASFVPDAHGRSDATRIGQGVDITQPEAPIDLPTLDADLAKQTIARETCLQQFNLYVDVCDMPLSQCLLQGSMPPSYSLGIAAIAPLSDCVHMNTYLEKANSWIKSCWEANWSSWSSATVAPHAFVCVSLLDSIFQESGTNNSRSASSVRDASISEAYKWVAIATSAQFAAHKGQTSRSSNDRDLAFATWSKAREMVFKNIAATDSFRQSLSLAFFGCILRVKGYSDEDKVFEEDATFALCEGIRRLDALCARAHSRLQRAGGDMQDTRTSGPIPNLPSEATANVMELIGALGWLASIVNDAVIASSHGDICPMDPASRFHRSRDSPSETELSSPQHGSDEDPDRAIVMRAQSEGQALMAFWGCGPSNDNLEQTVRQLGSLVIVLFKKLASFIWDSKQLGTGKSSYGQTQQHYETTLKLAEAWRSAFGTWDDATTTCFRQAPAGIRRIVAFCLTDGELAVLLLYDAARRLEIELAQQPSAPGKKRLLDALRSSRSNLRDQRLTSAVQISTLASISLGVTSPGFDGKSGLKASVQDIGAHPYPALVPQAYSLSAKAFVEEVNVRVNEMDINRASHMTKGLGACLQALQGLQDTLVALPDVSYYSGELAR